MRKGYPVLLALFVLLTGCGRSGYQEPEEVVRSVITVYRMSQVEEAVLHFDGDLSWVKNSPDRAKVFLDRITDRGNAVTFMVRERQARGEYLVLTITTYSDEAMQSPIGRSHWTFKKTKRGWVVTSVE